MQEQFALMADSCPTKKFMEVTCVSKRLIWAKYVKSRLAQGFRMGKTGSIASEVTFMRAWKLYHSHVRKKKFKRVSAKCSICDHLSHSLQLNINTGNREGADHDRDLLLIHNDWQMKERWWSHMRQEQMLNYPDDYLSLVSDGADQSHHKVPNLHKKVWDTDQLQQHLQLVYHKGKQVYCYRSFPNCRGDANRALECAYRALKQISDSNGGLPPVLYFDVDGGAENACMATSGFFGMLVHLDIVRKVIISRLPVGHTHREVDASIATGNSGLRAHNHNRVSIAVTFTIPCIISLPIDIITSLLSDLG